MNTPHTSLGLGVLDLCKVFPQQGISKSLTETIRLAIACEQFGYHRYWLGEHHTPDSSCSCPEILIPLIAAATDSIRVGLGGVILSYQSPIRVAELALSLEALFPERIDLGICKGPGVIDVQTSEELVWNNTSELTRSDFEKKFFALQSMIKPSKEHSGLSKNYLAKQNAYPTFWMLGSSLQSLLLATKFGCGFTLSLLNRGRLHIEDCEGKRIFNSQLFDGCVDLVAVSVICLETSKEADLEDQRLINTGRLAANIVGDPEKCTSLIDDLKCRYQVNEVLIFCPLRSAAEKLNSYEILASRIISKNRAASKTGL